MKKIRLLIADDHGFIIDGIKAMLATEQNIAVIGEASNGKQAVTKCIELKPDVVIIDISMPVMSGIEAAAVITKNNPSVRMLALTQHEDSEYVYQFLKSGGAGYLLKNSKKADFIDAIHKVYTGEKYISREASKMMITNYMDSRNEQDHTNSRLEVSLTQRETGIIRLILEDMSNKEIAQKLDISLRTVETHRRNIMQKLNINTVVALFKYAIQHKIITIK